MIEIKKGASSRVPVRLFDSSSGLPVAGKTYVEVSVSVEHGDGTVTVMGSPPTLDWAEVTSGDFAGTGKYTLILASPYTSVVGCLVYAVAGTGLKTYLGAVKVVDNEEVDTFSLIGAPASGTIAGDLVSAATKLQRILDINEGRWKLDKVAKQLIIYKIDGVTEIRRFDLYNDLGIPDVEVVFDKVPV